MQSPHFSVPIRVLKILSLPTGGRAAPWPACAGPREGLLKKSPSVSAGQGMLPAPSPACFKCHPRPPFSCSSPLHEALMLLFLQVFSKASDFLDCLTFAITNKVITVLARSASSPSPTSCGTFSFLAHCLYEPIEQFSSFLPKQCAGKRSIHE